MFEVMQEVFIQFIGYIPYIIGVWIIFDLLGSLLFSKR